MRQLLFFATDGDLLPVLVKVEEGGPLKYVRMGHSESDEPALISMGAELPGLGTATAASAINCQSYLVATNKTPIQVRPICVAGGLNKFSIDQSLNPETVVLSPGGQWNDEVVLHGRVATVSDSAGSQALMRRFAIGLKQFKKIKAFWVGPHARALLDAGRRLTIAAQSPREFDLKK